MEQYKFQKLQMDQLALSYADEVDILSRQLPERERFNIASQIERAATSIVLNIAEGTTPDLPAPGFRPQTPVPPARTRQIVGQRCHAEPGLQQNV